jgi:hypothetical protein
MSNTADYDRLEREQVGVSAWEIPESKGARRDFAAPLDAATSGRLEFIRGVAKATIRADPAMRDLYRAHFEGPIPGVVAQGGTVTIHYRHFSLSDWVKYALLGRHMADVTLNPSIPWQIAVRGGVSETLADLRLFQLTSLDVSGGASQAMLMLPHPTGTTPIRITGGASHVTLRRPVGVCVRVHVRRGASMLTLDRQHLGAIGGDVRLETPQYAGATDRYDIEILAGASAVAIEAQ